MSEFERLPSWFDDALEAYVDGELTERDRLHLEGFVMQSEQAADALRLARMVSRSLAEMPRPSCPPDIAQAALSLARAEARSSLMDRLRALVLGSWETVLRPSIAVGLFVLVVIAGTLMNRTQHVAPATASAQEVDQALAQARWTFAFISEVGRDTGRSLRDDVLQQRVARPVEHALDNAFDENSRIR